MSLFKDGSKIISGLGRIASSPAKGSTWKKNLSPEEKSFLNTHPASNFEAEYQFKQRFEKYKQKQSKKNEVENKKENLTISKTKTKESVKRIVKNNVNLEKKDHASKKGLNKFSDKFKNNLNIKNSWRDNLTQEEKRYLSSHPGPYFESEYTFNERFKRFSEEVSNKVIKEKVSPPVEVIQNKEQIDISKVEELKIALEKAKAEEERIALEIAKAEEERIALEKAKAAEQIKQGVNCLKCGTSFSDKDKFCKKCGAKRIINVISQTPVRKEIHTSENKKVLKKDPKEETPKDKIFNLTEELEKLAALKEKGLLTEEEFINAKAKLLN